jgi:hypothetical protein
VLETHGLRSLGEALHTHSRAGEWDQRAALVGDDVLALFCVRSNDPQAAAAAVADRMGGLVDSIGLNAGVDADLGALAPLAQALRAV